VECKSRKNNSGFYIPQKSSFGPDPRFRPRTPDFGPDPRFGPGPPKFAPFFWTPPQSCVAANLGPKFVDFLAKFCPGPPISAPEQAIFPVSVFLIEDLPNKTPEIDNFTRIGVFSGFDPPGPKIDPQILPLDRDFVDLRCSKKYARFGLCAHFFSSLAASLLFLLS